MRVLFAGTPAFSLSSLEALERHPAVELVAVYTQPDRLAGRGRKLTASAVKQRALALGVAVQQPLNFKSDQEVERLHAMNLDLMVVTAYGLILPTAVLDAPRLGCVNVHASLLPRWRGAAPIQRALQAGDAVTGVTLMQMDQGLDTGAMLAHTRVAIDSSDTAGELHDKLAHAGGQLLSDSLDPLAAGKLEAVPQNHSDACYAEKINKSEAMIDWNQPATVIDRQIRAFNPWPVAETWLGANRLRIHQAKPGKLSGLTRGKAPGDVLAVSVDNVEVVCGEGTLCLTRIQKSGGKPMDLAAFLNGSNLQPGMRFGQ